MSKTSPTRSATAGAVLGPVLRHHVGAFRDRAAQVRLSEPDSVRRFQVSVRRLRTLLAAFGTLVDAAPSAALEAGLRDTAGTLGGALDAEVVRHRLESLFGAEPDSDAVTDVRSQLGYLLERSYQESWQRAIAHFDSPGYDSFTRALDMFADLPPWTSAADTSAKQVFVPALRQEWVGLLRRGRGVQELEAGPDRDRQLHGVHRSAKRAKDIAEAQATISGRKVKRLRDATRELTTPLGEYGALLLTDDVLRKAGADLAGADGVIHRLQAREAAAAGTLYKEFVKSFRDADRKSLRSWMS